MTNIDIEKKHNNFLRLDRTIFEDYANNKISLDEKDILVHLQVWANPNNAKTKISYQGLADDFKGRYEKNAVNKIILSLKKKKYLWFPNQQGCRGSFIIIMNNYPLSNGYFTDLFKDSETTGRSLDSNIVDNSELCLAEVPTGWQKIKEQKDKLATIIRMKKNYRSLLEKVNRFRNLILKLQGVFDVKR